MNRIFITEAINKGQSRICKFISFAVLVSSLLIIPRITYGTTAQIQYIVNNLTKECAWFSEGDECTQCDKPWTWKSTDSQKCPSGYKEVTLNYTCKPREGRPQYCPSGNGPTQSTRSNTILYSLVGVGVLAGTAVIGWYGKRRRISSSITK
ncbi:MAG: hypothetical protein WC575_02615 [Patescibacteria group bacterium]